MRQCRLEWLCCLNHRFLLQCELLSLSLKHSAQFSLALYCARAIDCKATEVIDNVLPILAYLYKFFLLTSDAHIIFAFHLVDLVVQCCVFEAETPAELIYAVLQLLIGTLQLCDLIYEGFIRLIFVYHESY